MKRNFFTKEDTDFLINNYNDYLLKGELNELAYIMGRTKQHICRHARKNGLTNIFRKKSSLENFTPNKPNWSKTGHPKGMLGKKHTQETITKLKIINKSNQAKISSDSVKRNVMVRRMLETRFKNGCTAPHRVNATWKCGWREIGGKYKYFRSKWEANYARYLESIKVCNKIIEWEFESDVFFFNEIKDRCTSYLPDFKITCVDGSITYHEVKGWMDDRSKTKIEMMGACFPQITLTIIDKKWFNENSSLLSKTIEQWEN